MNLIGISRKVEDLLLLFSDKQIDGGCWWLLVVFISMGMNQRILRHFCSGWLFDMWPATMIHCQISSFLCRVRSPCHRHMPWLEGPQIQTQTLVLFGLFATCESLLKGKAWVAATIPTFRRRFEATGSSRLSPMFKGALEKPENWHSTHGCEGKSAGNPWFKPQRLWASVNYLFLLTVNQLR
jgi:hypothetical protein